MWQARINPYCACIACANFRVPFSMMCGEHKPATPPTPSMVRWIIGKRRSGKTSEALAATQDWPAIVFTQDENAIDSWTHRRKEVVCIIPCTTITNLMQDLDDAYFKLVDDHPWEDIAIVFEHDMWNKGPCAWQNEVAAFVTLLRHHGPTFRVFILSQKASLVPATVREYVDHIEYLKVETIVGGLPLLRRQDIHIYLLDAKQFDAAEDKTRFYA